MNKIINKMKIKRLLYFVPFAFLFITCEPQVTPPCEIENDLTHDFDGMELDFPITNAPFFYEDDHDWNPNDGKVDDVLLGIIENNHNARNDDGQITLTMTGRTCDGSKNRVYTSDDVGDVFYTVLQNGPATGYEVDLKLEIKSADYDYKKCYWERRYLEVSGFAWSHPTGTLYGTWISSNKAMDDGNERNVYVHNTFNGYIYNF